jgi:two-component system sensor histidine kinase DegS
MNKDVNESIQALNNSLLDENLHYKQIQGQNISRLEELEKLINSFENENGLENNLFLPRKNNSMDNNLSSLKKEEYLKEKIHIESENEIIKNEIARSEERIGNLQSVIKADPFLNRFVFLDMQEKERQRIARDLHDSSLQNLTHLIHAIELSTLFIDQDADRAKLELAMVGKKLRMIIDEIRSTIFDLRPMEFDDLGFKGALQNMVDRFRSETDIFINLNMDDDIPISNELIFSNIYRIIRECVINSIKHSEARSITINVYEKNNYCHTEISDDGKGFHTGKENQKHFGLQILEERIQLLKGSINIETCLLSMCDKNSKTPGTVIKIEIPINNA